MGMSWESTRPMPSELIIVAPRTPDSPKPASIASRLAPDVKVTALPPARLLLCSGTGEYVGVRRRRCNPGRTLARRCDGGLQTR